MVTVILLEVFVIVLKINKCCGNLCIATNETLIFTIFVTQKY